MPKSQGVVETTMKKKYFFYLFALRYSSKFFKVSDMKNESWKILNIYVLYVAYFAVNRSKIFIFCLPIC